MKMMKKRICTLLIALAVAVLYVTPVFATGSAAATEAGTDTRLVILDVDPGSLTPAFDPDVHEYTAYVGPDCDKVVVSAATADSGARMVVAGNSGLVIGENKVIITVTGADRTTTGTYTIIAVRGEIPETTAASIAEGNQALPGVGVADALTNAETAQETTQAEETAEETPAEGEAAETTLAEGETAETAAETAAETQPAQTEAQPAQASAGCVVTSSRTITLADPDPSVIPDGFSATQITIGSETVNAWKFPDTLEADGFVLLYGSDANVSNVFFIYEVNTGNAVAAADGIMNAGAEATLISNRLQEVKENYQKKLKERMYIIIGLAAGCMILLIAFTAAMTRKRKPLPEDELDERRSGTYDEDGPEAYDEEPYEEDPYDEEDDEDGDFEEGEAYEDADDLDEEAYDDEDPDDAYEEDLDEAYDDEDYDDEDYDDEDFDDEDYDDEDLYDEAYDDVDGEYEDDASDEDYDDDADELFDEDVEETAEEAVEEAEDLDAEEAKEAVEKAAEAVSAEEIFDFGSGEQFLNEAMKAEEKSAEVDTEDDLDDLFDDEIEEVEEIDDFDEETIDDLFEEDAKSEGGDWFREAGSLDEGDICSKLLGK